MEPTQKQNTNAAPAPAVIPAVAASAPTAKDSAEKEFQQKEQKFESMLESLSSTKKTAKRVVPMKGSQAELDVLMGEMTQKKEEEKATTQAKKLGISYIDLTNYPASPAVLSLIPLELVEKYKIIPYIRSGNKVKIAMLDAENEATLGEIKNLGQSTGLDFDIAITDPASFDYLVKLYKISVQEKTNPEGIKIGGKQEEGFEAGIKTLGVLAERVKQVPTTELLELILTGAIKLGASDIHIEPREKEFRIRYRIDGVLQDVVILPRTVFNQIMSRIKYLSKLRMDTAAIPQDGRFSFEAVRQKVDVRVSILPTVYGESVVSRLLRQTEKFLTLEELGFRGQAKKIIEEAVGRPNGMILNTGPTGSGKTTTLYAVLDKLNKPGVKIITLEDPVEYRITGIVQAQIEPDKGFSFGAGLRSVLRQDPDIVMVGEIRDFETAETAVQAALTGHILLSTLHTNNAAGAIPRLIEMGIKPFLLLGSLNAIIAQRLVRRICPACREEYLPMPEVMTAIQAVWDKTPAAEKGSRTFPQKLIHGKGCEACHNTGYSGRITVIEILTLNKEIEKLTLDLAPVSEIQKAAVASGMVTMEMDGILKIIDGLTTIDEVWRVTRE